MPFVPQSSLAISRFFLERAKRDNVRDVTPMKVLKLVYIAHGWVLCFTDQPLLSEKIQAWKYGPVVPSVYHKFKEFGDSSIPFSVVESLPQLTTEDDQVADALAGVWNGYKGFTGIQLSSLTHQPNTPWYETWHASGGRDSRSAIIDNQTIRRHYCDLLKQADDTAKSQ